MAYGLLYYNEVTSLRFGRTMRFEILERDYVGASSEIKMDATISLSKSGDGREESIKKKTANIEILSTVSFEFQHLFTSDDKKYQFKVTRAGTTIFIGFLETDSYGEPYAFYQNYMVQFTARDNLGTLEDIDYLDGSGDKLSGLQKITEIINNTLIKTGYFLNKNDLTTKRSSDMSELLVPFDQSYINNDGFWNYDDNEPVSCLEVITRILTGFGAQLRQIGDLWQIREQARYFEMPFINGDDIIPRFLQSVLNLNITPNDTYWLNQSANLILQPAWKSFILNQSLEKNNSISTFPNIDSEFVLPQTGWLTELRNWSNSEGSVSNAYSPLDRSWISFPHLDIPGQSDSIPYYMQNITDIESTLLSLTIKMDTISVFRQFDGAINNNKEQPLADMDVNFDLLNTDGVDTSILTSSGWVAYVAQEKQLSFNNIPPGEITIIADGIPYSGELWLRIWAGTGQTANNGDIKYKSISVELQNDSFISEINLNANIDINNNLSESFDLNIGQAQDIENSRYTQLGGLFTSAGVAQVDWKRPEDTTAKNLLECVAEGYDLLNNRVSRQISGELFWDWDFNYNLKDQGRTLMINSGTWDPVNDTLNAEFIEVFEYKTTGAYDEGHDDGFEINDTGDYKTNSTFTLSQKSE